jgi:cobyric acid synthase CobQ/L-threonine-O-3-phosphate decarboxylase
MLWRVWNMKEFKHGGHIRELAARSGLPEDSIIDFSANINPLGPPDWLRQVVSSSLDHVDQYPDPECKRLKEALAEKYGRRDTEALVGNGSTELIYLAPQVAGKNRAIIAVPSYIDYEAASLAAGLEVEHIELREDRAFELDLDQLESRLKGDELVFLARPNNPTGVSPPHESILTIVGKYPETLFIIDEAFVDLSLGMTSYASIRAENLMVLISLTKSFAIPGLRLGAAFAVESLARRISEAQQPWSVNNLAQAVGLAAIKDREYLRQSRIFVDERRKELQQRLAEISQLKVYDSTTNFILCRIQRPGISAKDVCGKTLSHGVSIRNCDNFKGLAHNYIRVAVRRSEENEKLVWALNKVFGRDARPGRKKKPAIMFQGVSSNAGKSILTAGLCRCLLEDGHRVAPFKAQNMSLNSYVTRDGKEMGRAQVVQAQACGLAPDVRMNPVLLKPSSDTGSQVILMGEPVGAMNVSQYVNFKPKAFAAAKQAYDSLGREYDVMVLEGAGSPAEVNLKSHDIVNMAMAEHADAVTLLVGDIDRGGVFASFIGVMETLAQWERRLVAGFVVNRFRGDPALLKEAYEYTLAHTNKPTLGLIPYIDKLGLPEEDSVTFKAGLKRSLIDPAAMAESKTIEIALIDLPHISNFTDMDCFENATDVVVRIVGSVADLGEPDAIIIPGSKNVIGDLKYLVNAGLAASIHNMRHERDVEIVGICGGFQMLGRSVKDPLGIESSEPHMDGLGLLECSTVLAKDKRLTLADGVHLASGKKVSGYEIHHGVTERNGLAPALELETKDYDGAVSRDGLVWGAYMHGLFDSDSFRAWFINRLRKRKGLAELQDLGPGYDLGPAFQRLANIVREGLDLKKIYAMAGL